LCLLAYLLCGQLGFVHVLLFRHFSASLSWVLNIYTAAGARCKEHSARNMRAPGHFTSVPLTICTKAGGPQQLGAVLGSPTLRKTLALFRLSDRKKDTPDEPEETPSTIWQPALRQGAGTPGSRSALARKPSA